MLPYDITVPYHTVSGARTLQTTNMMCIFIIYDDNVVVHEDVVATVYIKEDNSCVYLFYSAGCTLRKNHQTEEINDDLVCCLSRSRLYGINL